MIGVVVQGTGKEAIRFDPLVYHRFSTGFSSIEHTVKHCMDSAFIHRVVLTMPMTERKMVQGLDLKGRFGRLATTLFYDEATEDTLDALYYAALHHSFDHVIRVHANCPLLPGWAINDCVKDYMSTHSAAGLYKNYGDELSGPGFEIEVMPFWWLADKFVNIATDRDRYISVETTSLLPSDGKDVIRTGGESFVFDSLDKAESMEAILETVAQGYDVNDVVMEYIDGYQQKGSQKQQEAGE